MKPTGATKEFANAGGRPWKLYAKFSTLREPYQIQDADGVVVASINYDPSVMDSDDAEDNAQLIVTAVNERERLRALLKATINAMRSYQYGNSAPDLADEIQQAVNAALNGEQG